MTSRGSKACVICMNDFDATDRQTVALPCGHNFCLTCLVRLKASDSPVCPQCRQSFAEVVLPRLSRMAKASGKSDFMKKGRLALCKGHEEPFVYWSTSSNELYCTTCILSVAINTSCLKRISDAIPLIQDDLESKVWAVKKGITSDRENHKEEREKAVQELARIKTFEMSILRLKDDYQQFIEKVDSHNSKLRIHWFSVNEIEENISEILGEKDIEIVLSYRETLEGLHKTFACHQQERNFQRGGEEGIIDPRRLAIEYHPSMSPYEAAIYYQQVHPHMMSPYEAPRSYQQVPHMMRPAKLLSDIACVFEEGERQEAAFIPKLQQKMQQRNNRFGSVSGYHAHISASVYNYY